MSEVMNVFTELIIEFFVNKGHHTRFDIWISNYLRNIPVEVEMIVKIKEYLLFVPLLLSMRIDSL